MISGSVVVPFQKGPCGEGGRMRGFLLPLLEEAAVVVLVLVLLLIFLNPPLLTQHKSKQNKFGINEKFKNCSCSDGHWTQWRSKEQGV